MRAHPHCAIRSSRGSTPFSAEHALALLRHFSSIAEAVLTAGAAQVQQRIEGPQQHGADRRQAGLWRRSGAGFSPPSRLKESEDLKEGEGDLAQKQVVVQPLPNAPFELVEPEVFFEMLMGLLTALAGLDQTGEHLQWRLGRQIAPVVLPLSGVAPLAETPDRRSAGASCLGRAAHWPRVPARQRNSALTT